MDVTVALGLLKANIGMNSSYRDPYLTAVIEGVISELTEEKGIKLDAANANHLMFVVDYSAWRFLNKDANTGMPDHLRFRLRNLYVHSGGGPVV